jgi:hypothetical protein
MQGADLMDAGVFYIYTFKIYNNQTPLFDIIPPLCPEFPVSPPFFFGEFAFKNFVSIYCLSTRNQYPDHSISFDLNILISNGQYKL